MSHHVQVTLPPPDGRTARADYRQPIVTVMRRVLKAAAKGGPYDGNPADYALIAEWLDHCPDQQCDDLTACTHPPAVPDPGLKLPPYRRPVLDGLW